MIVTVEKGEAFQIGRRPSVLALEELVDFALRSRTVVDGRCVCVFGDANLRACITETIFYNKLKNH